MTTIMSLSNPQIKKIERLKKASVRRQSGLVVVDGVREIELAIKAGLKIETIFYCHSLAKSNQQKFPSLKEGKTIEVSEAVFKKICYKEKPDGFLALIHPNEQTLDQIKLSPKPLLIILEAVEKPGNLGAIIRTAYASGAEAIIINDSQTDIYNPNVIRASEGFIFTKPIVISSVKETVAWLKSQKIKIFAAATSSVKKYTEVDLKSGAAIVLGSEAQGLGSEWLKAADELIKIPMQMGIDSLNVSVSGAIIMYEVLRQRGEK